MAREPLVARMFAHPRGLPGRIGGWLMARGNAKVNRVAALLLELRPDDRVLEIGFGPGVTLSLLARCTPAGHVAGVDVSATMLDVAARRNRSALATGRMELRQAGVSRLPFPDGAFTAALACNSFQFWPSPSDDLREVRRVLAGGGRLVLGLHLQDPRRPFTGKVGYREPQLVEIANLVREAGFAEVRVERPAAVRARAAYVWARRG